MIRKLTIVLSLLLVTTYTYSQIYDPVTWDFSYEKKGEKQYELVFTASIEEHSHIYSMDIPDGGPIPTSFRFDSSANYILEGKPFEVNEPVELFDEAFGFKIKTFSSKAEFRQKVTAVASSFSITGSVNFMACNNVTCSPPKDVDFELKIAEQGALQTVSIDNTAGSDSAPASPGKGLLKFFLISLLAGFAGVLTPCVYLSTHRLEL